MAVFNETPDTFVDLNDLFPVLNEQVGLSVEQFRTLVENTIYLFNRKGAKFRYRGEWDATTTYYNNETYFDCVTYNGAVYVLKTATSVGETPSSSTNWESILLKIATSINADSSNEYVAGAKATYDLALEDWTFQKTITFKGESNLWYLAIDTPTRNLEFDLENYDYKFELVMNINLTQSAGEYYQFRDKTGNSIQFTGGWISDRVQSISEAESTASANPKGWSVIHSGEQNESIAGIDANKQTGYTTRTAEMIITSRKQYSSSGVLEDMTLGSLTISEIANGSQQLFVNRFALLGITANNFGGIGVWIENGIIFLNETTFCNVYKRKRHG
jgi:hypothetical protein